MTSRISKIEDRLDMIPETQREKLLNAINCSNSKFMETITEILHEFEDLFSEEDIRILTDKEQSRNILKQDYPVLLQVDSTKDKMEQIHLSGNYRYYASKKCVIKGTEYYYTSQLYGLGASNSHGDNRTPLWKWVCDKVGVSIEDHVKEKEGEKIVADKKELEIIKSYISSQGFTFDDGLIENYYLCLKSKPFVILAGISGTGKTRLVRLFAEAIGATTQNGRYKLVPVRPDWSDSSDLFGHVDLNGKFIPGAIIDFVKKAELDIKNPYFLCLDEMNLARVEYYLSDILSVIETREIVDGQVITDPLVSENFYGADSKAAGKYGTLRIPENLYIIGTVNMDETTFPFSRKVLDRANTIEFSTVDLSTNFYNGEAIPVLQLDNYFMKSEYVFFNQCNDHIQLVKDVCSNLQKLNEILETANAHVGYRVRDEIVFYMINNANAGLLKENDAFDYEIMQKILPRIQGSSASVKKILCELFKFCAGDYEGYQTESDDISSKMLKVAKKENCKYGKSAQKIAYMVRRYEEDGFTAYWF